MHLLDGCNVVGNQWHLAPPAAAHTTRLVPPVPMPDSHPTCNAAYKGSPTDFEALAASFAAVSIVPSEAAPLDPAAENVAAAREISAQAGGSPDPSVYEEYPCNRDYMHLFRACIDIYVGFNI